VEIAKVGTIIEHICVLGSRASLDPTAFVSGSLEFDCNLVEIELVPCQMRYFYTSIGYTAQGVRALIVGIDPLLGFDSCPHFFLDLLAGLIKSNRHFTSSVNRSRRLGADGSDDMPERKEEEKYKRTHHG
jgi:hypothetical protein